MSQRVEQRADKQSFILMLRPFFPEPVMSADLLSFEHPLVLLFCFVWLRITDEGSVPDMRIWSILLIKFDFKWCIHLSRSLFLYSNY